jgi:hypothetical protein
MPRPNLRFSIIVFGAGLAYTLLDKIPVLRHDGGLNLPLLGGSLVLMYVISKISVSNHNSQ